MTNQVRINHLLELREKVAAAVWDLRVANESSGAIVGTLIDDLESRLLKKINEKIGQETS